MEKSKVNIDEVMRYHEVIMENGIGLVTRARETLEMLGEEPTDQKVTGFVLGYVTAIKEIVLTTKADPTFTEFLLKEVK